MPAYVPGMHTSSALPAFVFVAMAIAGCGEQPAPPTSSAPESSPSLLTTEELTALFLKDAQVWKFTAQPGIAAKSVSVRIIDDGKPRTSTTSYLGESERITSVIVVAQQIDKQHVLKCYVKHIGGSSLSTSRAWFSKPLQVWSSTTHKEPAPLQAGTVTLLSGSSDSPEAGKTYSSETSPCRLELVIE